MKDAWHLKREQILANYGSSDWVWLFRQNGDLLVQNKFTLQTINLGPVEPEEPEPNPKVPEA